MILMFSLNYEHKVWTSKTYQKHFLLLQLMVKLQQLQNTFFLMYHVYLTVVMTSYKQSFIQYPCSHMYLNFDKVILQFYKGKYILIFTSNSEIQY